ncbi:MAG: GntR family transcriptional regulator [Bdellovibrionota bacterium]
MGNKSFIDINSQIPIFQQIVNETERQILVGELRDGDFLISVREFASVHTINPNTVSKAYQLLQTMGLVEAIRGKGLKVKKIEDKIAASRKESILKERIFDLIQLSKALNISKHDLIEIIKANGEKK